ncbi:hypothetical protein NV379_06610 [Paenibacillus sp. N1-5-1-14]|uniref:hypothetical protein n=1 Tax=Paenibacillus radicibacter TaxID=2972488 RepID=UPI0021591BBD|nr:hypothetical protein [Paenibacillus radicibacter]MCR8642329.1 hypothetical protein [Paenibacillus radicibacter]
MEKRLTRTDYLIATLTIFMLVCVLGAFFIGFKIGKDRTDKQWQQVATQEAKANSQIQSYDQQQLALFYHSIYIPYKNFQSKWFQTEDELGRNSQTVNSANAVKDLVKLADSIQKELQDKSMPENSPLLQQASSHYQTSLQSFNKGLQSFVAKANSMPGTDLIHAMSVDAQLQEAKKSALTAQKEYYTSIVKWQQSNNPKAASKSLDSTKKISFEEWNTSNIHMKNEYIATLMLQSGSYSEYLPHDMTARIDELLAKGEMQNLGISDVPAAVQLLNGTNAVRTDYFTKLKAKYAQETLPNVPFFQ